MSYKSKRLTNLILAIETNRLRKIFLEEIISGKENVSSFSIGDSKRSLPKVIEEGKNLRYEYQRIIGKRYYKRKEVIQSVY